MIEAALKSDELAWKKLQIKNGEYLIQAGEVEKFVYFVESGALRAFTYVEEEEITIRFGYSGSILTALPSYITQTPSELYIQALRKSTVLQCKRSEFESYIQASKERLIAYKELLNQLIAGIMEREIDLMHTSPKSRIERLQKRSPQLFQEVPQKYIAAYLRMSPETLSRLLSG
ncbi:MAG: Crp/Fnr family transcriptional regulator [Vicingaceae bacterium]